MFGPNYGCIITGFCFSVELCPLTLLSSAMLVLCAAFQHMTARKPLYLSSPLFLVESKGNLMVLT